jgi:two-component system phosphate regulon response regulator PhoB
MKKVLIIEDDKDTLEVLGLIAEKLNFEVVLFDEVVPILAIENINPDLIILDHWLGSKKGGDLCFQLKENPITADIPVILLSAMPDIGQIALDNKADGCLFKPFKIDEIEDVLIAYLG